MTSFSANDSIPSTPSTPLVTPPRRIHSGLGMLRRMLTRNMLRDVFLTARLRVSIVVFCSVFFWLSLFGFFLAGFRFINKFDIFAPAIIEYAFSMFFLSLLFMLFFSAGIIIYNGLFHAREAEFLLVTPAAADQVFAYKFVEAMAFACWGFLLIGSPLMIAYGISVSAPWWFYLVFLGYLVAFSVIPGGLGAVAALVIANILPRRHKTVLGLSLGVCAVAGVIIVFRILRTPGIAFSEDWMDGLVGRLSFSQHPLLPSRWLSVGLVGAARGRWFDGLFYLGVTAANAAMAYLLAALAARDLYRPGYGKVQGGRSSRRMFGWYGFDATLHRVFAPIPHHIRVLILKDIRTFRRDPAQWSQFLIFFGLLTFYFLTIRRLSYDTQSGEWRNMLSFLNLSVTALLLSTFMSRFIFPLLSLEGRNMWVLGLLPLKRESILWGKFGFAAGISIVSSMFLVLLSDSMLRMGWGMMLLHCGLITMVCLGLAGISVGLGARFPNLREPDPSKIATGFGGTLNLLLSLVFILVSVLAIALPCHMYFSSRDASATNAVMWTDAGFQKQIVLASLASFSFSVAATLIPLRIGIKAFRSMEL